MALALVQAAGAIRNPCSHLLVQEMRPELQVTPGQIVLAVKACILLALLGLAYYLGGASARVNLANYQVRVAKQATHVAELTARASELARKEEQARAAHLAAIDKQYQEDIARVKTESDRLAADLRSGNRKLHQRWQAALATSELSRAVKSASGLDAEARDREGSAGAIIAAADRCDAQVEGLQRVIRADRQ